MALRILWDKYETALLIDAWLGVEKGTISRQEAITSVSKTLRERAIKNGIEIDNIFRNENGISMQLNSVQRLMQHQPDAKRHNTKIFIEMTELYFNDKDRFNAVLREAKGYSNQMKTKEELFADWLSANVSPNRLSDYFMSIRDVEVFAKKKRLISGSIYDVSDPLIISKLINAINADHIFRFTYKKQMRNITKAVQLFYRYTKENQNKAVETLALSKQESVGEEIATVVIPPEDNNILTVDLAQENDFAFTKPISVSYFGETFNATSWRELYVRVCQILFDDYPQIFRELRDAPTSEDGKYLVYDEVTSKRLLAPACIAEGYYVETKRSASYLMHRVKTLLDVCRVDYENLEIRYCHDAIAKQTSIGIAVTTKRDTTNDDPLLSYLNAHGLKYIDLRGRHGCLWIIGGQEIAEIIRPLQRCGVSVSFKHGGGNATSGKNAWWTKDAPTVLRFPENSDIQNTDNTPADVRKAFNKYLRFQGGEMTTALKGTQQLPASSISYYEIKVARAEFKKWFIEQGLSEGTANGYISAVSVIDEYVRKHSILEDSLFTIADVEVIKAAWDQFQNDEQFMSYNHEQRNRFLEGICRLIKYRSGSAAENVAESKTNSFESEDGLRFEFEEWLKKKGVDSTTVQNRLVALDTIGNFAIQLAASNKPMFQIADPAELLQIWITLRANREFRNWVREHSEGYTVTVRYYDQFLKARMNRHVSSTAVKTYSISATKKHPCQIEFEVWLSENGTPKGSVQTYSNAVKRIGDYLLENRKEYRHIFSIFGIPRLEHIRESLQHDQSYADSVGNVNTLLDFYAFRKYISFRKNNAVDGVDEVTLVRYSTLLKDNFENGFRVNSMIDRNRFKQYYADLYGEEIELNDEVIVETIKQIGKLQDDRVFARDGNSSEDILDDIQADIAETFGKGASCIYIASVFEKYQYELVTQLKIYTEDLLCEQLIATCYGTYRVAKQKIFFIKGRNPDASVDVQKIMKQSPLPMTYDQIHDILWYIPIDQIKHSLVTTDGMVNVAQETYFYAYNLPVSNTELERIAELLHTQLMQKTFITDAELRALISQHVPSVAINTDAFSTWGFRNALAVLLGDRFSFNGAIISEQGQEINMAQAFEAFCEMHEKMSLDELKGFAKEMNSTIYWEAVYNKMLRVSQQEFLKRGSVEFDVERIDAVLDQLIESDYVPLRKFSLFLHFPTVSVKWNEFVLEAYTAQYSRDFMLLHASYSAAECCGAIVRKSSRIQNFKTLLTEVLAKSNEWKTQEDALALLVKKGYLQKKRYSEIDIVIADARQLKGNPVKAGESVYD